MTGLSSEGLKRCCFRQPDTASVNVDVAGLEASGRTLELPTRTPVTDGQAVESGWGDGRLHVTHGATIHLGIQGPQGPWTFPGCPVTEIFATVLKI